MKNLFLLLILTFSLNYVSAQGLPKIKGSRVVTDHVIELDAFDGISLNADFKITLQEGATPKVELVIDDNLIEVLDFHVRNGLLEISTTHKIVSKKSLDIKVYYTKINSLVVNTGKIICPDWIVSPQLNVEVRER